MRAGGSLNFDFRNTFAKHSKLVPRDIVVEARPWDQSAYCGEPARAACDGSLSFYSWLRISYFVYLIDA